MTTVAIIEDDKNMNNHLKKLIEGLSGTTVTQYFDRISAEDAVKNHHYDLIILDIELGESPQDKLGGLGILHMLGGKKTVTLVVSGTSEENLPDIVITLQAYDFIGKPINDLNFIRKVEHALLSQISDTSKYESEKGQRIWPSGLTPDPDRYPGFFWKGKRVRLSLTQIRLLNCLIKNPGVPVESSKLAKQLDTSNSQSAIATHMSDIRQRFIFIDPEFDVIEPDPGKGYVWST